MAIGQEFLGAGQLAADGVRAYAEGVISCLQAWRLLPGEPAPPPTQRVYTGDWQYAPHDGLFEALVPPRAGVTEGQPVARILGIPQGNWSLHTERAGTVLGLRSRACIREGDWAVLIGREAMR